MCEAISTIDHLSPLRGSPSPPCYLGLKPEAIACRRSAT